MLFKHILRDLGRWVLLAFGLFVIASSQGTRPPVASGDTGKGEH